MCAKSLQSCPTLYDPMDCSPVGSSVYGTFLYSSSVYPCHLSLISSASVRYLPFLSFIVPIFAWNVPLVSLIFFKKSLLFPILFSFISLHCSLRAFLSLFAILWNSAFSWVYLSLSHLPYASLLFTATCKAASNNPFAFLHLFFLRTVWVTASCTMLWTSIQSSSGTLSIRYSPLNLFVSSTV